LLKNLPAVMRWTARLQQVSGALMILIGLYFLWIA